MGDVNDNGYVDLNDIEIIQNSMVNPGAPLTAEQFEVADINRDGKVSIRDCQYIQNYLIGRIDSLDDIKDYVPVVYTVNVRFRDEMGKVIFSFVCDGVEGSTYEVVLAPAVDEFARHYNVHDLIRVRSSVYGTIPVTSLASEYVLLRNDVVDLYVQLVPDCEHRDVNDDLQLPAIKAELAKNEDVTLVNKTKNEEYKLICDVSERQKDILSAGSLLDFTKKENN